MLFFRSAWTLSFEQDQIGPGVTDLQLGPRQKVAHSGFQSGFGDWPLPRPNFRLEGD